MADNEPKKPGIPAWQQANNTASTSSSEPPSQTSDDNDTTSRSALLEKAAKFLEDESIKNESTWRKIAFLESKGLRADEIDSVIGVSRNVEASSADTTATPDKNEEPSGTSDSASVSSASQESQVAIPSTSSPSSPAPSSSTPATTNQSTPRDVPPIITYPEFLTKQPKPPPLVSFNSIVYTLYGALGLGASMYGASEYLVKPMIANLTSARHDFAQNTKQNLRKLNEKLEQNVSVIPPELASRADRGSEEFDRADDDLDSITSDPAELFHRDIGTQTAPQDIASPVSKDKPAEEKPSPTATVTNHLNRIENIKSQLGEVASTEDASTAQDDSLRSSLRDMHYYLDSLIYSNPSYSTGYGTWSSSSDSSNAAMGFAKSEEDAISSFRSEIRGVKGALLSAKNFPTSRGRVGSGIHSSR